MIHKKIVFIIYSLNSGGAERVTANLANYWAGKGWNITVATLAPQNDDFYELHPAVKRIALELAGDSGNALVGLMQNLRRVFALRRILRETRPDVALGMMTGANVLLALATLRLPEIRAIGSERVHPPQHQLSMCWEWLRHRTYGRLAAIAALTSESADWIKAHTNARRVRVIPNSAVWPLAIHKPHLDVASVCPFGRKLLLAAGRLSDQKQFGLLVESFQNLASQYAEWDLVILGEGPLRSALQEQVLAVGLGNRIFLPGKAGNMGEWYERADLYVLPSRFEGFPNVLVEAMAYGLPAVSFNCDTGPRDIIRHKVDGLLVPLGDMAGLTTALGRLMGDAALRQRFAARAVDVRYRFSLERIAAMWEAMFKEAHQ